MAEVGRWDSGNTADANDSYSFTTTVGSGWDGKVRQASGTVHYCYVIPNIEQEVRDMRGLFRIYVVDPEKGKVLSDMLVIAKDKETAKIKTLAPLADKYDLDDLDVICNRLGDVRKKREVTEVRVVKE